MTMKVKSQCLVRGIFGLSACQKDDDGNVIPGTVRDLGTFDDMDTSETPGGSPNLITNNGMELLKDSGFLRYIMVGSGSSTPAVTDTTLDSFVAGVSLSQSNVSEGPSDLNVADYPWCSANVSKQFGKGEAAGNLSEVGIGKSQNNMFARALIKDSSGDPTTITVLPIEYLTVTYQWRVYWDLTQENTDTFTIESTTYTTKSVVSVVYSGGAKDWDLYGPVSRNLTPTNGQVFAVYTGDRGGSGSGYPGGDREYISGKATAAPGGVGDYHVDYSQHAGTGVGNIAIKSVAFPVGSSVEPACSLKFSVDPPLVKDNTKELDVTIRLAWGRKVP